MQPIVKIGNFHRGFKRRDFPPCGYICCYFFNTAVSTFQKF